MNKHRIAVIILAALFVSNLSGCVAMGVAAVGGTAMVASDRRSSGAYLDDASIELHASSQISQRIPNAHVNINSYNRAILMSGEVPDAAAHDQAEIIARAQPNARRIFNYTTISPVSSMSMRSNDAWITTKVHSNLVATKDIPSNQIKITTERGVVYLMGLLTTEEAVKAAKVASETAGVQQVITLFETYSELPK